jgi:hypothetical protein
MHGCGAVFLIAGWPQDKVSTFDAAASFVGGYFHAPQIVPLTYVLIRTQKPITPRPSPRTLPDGGKMQQMQRCSYVQPTWYMISFPRLDLSCSWPRYCTGFRRCFVHGTPFHDFLLYDDVSYLRCWSILGVDMYLSWRIHKYTVQYLFHLRYGQKGWIDLFTILRSICDAC